MLLPIVGLTNPCCPPSTLVPIVGLTNPCCCPAAKETPPTPLPTPVVPNAVFLEPPVCQGAGGRAEPAVFDDMVEAAAVLPENNHDDAVVKVGSNKVKVENSMVTMLQIGGKAKK